MLRWACAFIFVFTFALLATGCRKQPAVEHTGNNTNAGNANQQGQPAALAPYALPTLKGDIERASLAISSAQDAVKLNKWQDAVALLQSAEKNVDEALTRKSRLREEFEALKAAIERTIPLVENREKESDGRLVELGTRIGAIKVNTFAP